MNKLRCVLFASIVLISGATFASGGVIQGPGKSGVIQGPGKSDPTPTPTPTALTSTSTSNGLTQPTLTEQNRIVWQDATAILMDILLTIF